MAATAASWLSKIRAGPVKVRVGRIHPGRLDDAAVLREVAKQHGQTAVAAVGVFEVPDAALGTIQVQLWPLTGLAEGDLGGDPARCRKKRGLRGTPRRQRTTSQRSRASPRVRLCTVGTSRWISPARSSSPRMPITPPARCTSSIWYF